MSTTNAATPTDKLSAAVDDLKGAEREDLEAYLAKVDAIVDVCRAIRGEHKKELANIASKRSRARKAERVAKAMALLEAQEKAEEIAG